MSQKTRAARMLAHPQAAPRHHVASTHSTDGTAHLAPACAACREPAGPMHGSTVWRLCDNCRTLTRSPAALAVIRAHIAATLDAQRRASVRRAAR